MDLGCSLLGVVTGSTDHTDQRNFQQQKAAIYSLKDGLLHMHMHNIQKHELILP